MTLLFLSLLSSQVLAGVVVDDLGNTDAREILTLRPDIGNRQLQTVQVSMDLGMHIGPMPMDVPPVVMTMRVASEVTDVAENGDITYNYGFLDVAADVVGAAPEVVADANYEISQMTGITGHETLSAKGLSLSRVLNLPEGFNPDLKNQLEDAISQYVQFPEEAIGTGGAWTVSQEVTENGLQLLQHTTYTLTERTGDILALDMKVTQTPSSDEMALNTLPPGTDATLRTLNSSGAGTATMQLDHLLPLMLENQVNLESVFDLTSEGELMPVEMTATVSVKMTSTIPSKKEWKVAHKEAGLPLL